MIREHDGFLSLEGRPGCKVRKYCECRGRKGGHGCQGWGGKGGRGAGGVHMGSLRGQGKPADLFVMSSLLSSHMPFND